MPSPAPQSLPGRNLGPSGPAWRLYRGWGRGEWWWRGWGARVLVLGDAARGWQRQDRVQSSASVQGSPHPQLFPRPCRQWQLRPRGGRQSGQWPPGLWLPLLCSRALHTLCAQYQLRAVWAAAAFKGPGVKEGLNMAAEAGLCASFPSPDLGAAGGCDPALLPPGT